MSDSYDVVVVGAGLGGVSAAAFLARAGKRVLVVEQLEGPGGYAHAFRRGDYVFDPAIRTIGQGVAEPTLDTMLAALGVRDRCELLPIDHFYGAVFPDASFVVPAGRQEFVDFHCKHFPRDADGFRRFMDVCEQVTRESLEFMPVGLSLAELDAAAIRYPTLFRYLKATLGDVLEEFVQDERLRALCAAGWPYLGLPPSKLSFFTWTAMIMSLLEPGPFYSRGSFQRIVDAFVAAVAKAGGDLELGRRVTSIELDGDGRVKGVALDDGRTVAAPVVVSNADAGQTLE